jgi:hypothetical protein
LVALIVFSPVIWWNYRHGWASFGFQLRHGTGAGDIAPHKPLIIRAVQSVGNVAAYIGGQAMVWTPILFGVT